MPTFERCDKSVDKMATEILKQFETHAPLLNAKVKIDFVFAYAPKDDDGFPVGDALKCHGWAADGICRILPAKQRALGRGDAEISLDGDRWNDYSEEERRALLDHELHHLQVKMKNGLPLRDSLTRPLLKMRKHDVQFGWFAMIAARHSAAAGERKQAQQLMDGWGQYFWPELAKPSPNATSQKPTDSIGKSRSALIDGPNAEDEELIQKCIEVIRSEQRASVSLIQRRYRIGYAHATRIMDALEARGIVGPSKGAEPRDILIQI